MVITRLLLWDVVVLRHNLRICGRYFYISFIAASLFSLRIWSLLVCQSISGNYMSNWLVHPGSVLTRCIMALQTYQPGMGVIISNNFNGPLGHYISPPLIFRLHPSILGWSEHWIPPLGGAMSKSKSNHDLGVKNVSAKWWNHQSHGDIEMYNRNEFLWQAIGGLIVRLYRTH